MLWTIENQLTPRHNAHVFDFNYQLWLRPSVNLPNKRRAIIQANRSKAKQLNKIIVFFSMSNRCCDIWGLYNENDQREKTSNEMTIQNNAFKAMTTIVSQSREISATLHNPIHVLFSNFVFIRSSIFFLHSILQSKKRKKNNRGHTFTALSTMHSASRLFHSFKRSWSFCTRTFPCINRM